MKLEFEEISFGENHCSGETNCDILLINVQKKIFTHTHGFTCKMHYIYFQGSSLKMRKAAL